MAPKKQGARKAAGEAATAWGGQVVGSFHTAAEGDLAVVMLPNGSHKVVVAATGVELQEVSGASVGLGSSPVAARGSGQAPPLAPAHEEGEKPKKLRRRSTEEGCSRVLEDRFGWLYKAERRTVTRGSNHTTT